MLDSSFCCQKIQQNTSLAVLSWGRWLQSHAFSLRCLSFDDLLQKFAFWHFLGASCSRIPCAELHKHGAFFLSCRALKGKINLNYHQWQWAHCPPSIGRTMPQSPLHYSHTFWHASRYDRACIQASSYPWVVHGQNLPLLSHPSSFPAAYCCCLPPILSIGSIVNTFSSCLGCLPFLIFRGAQLLKGRIVWHDFLAKKIRGLYLIF